MAIERSLSRKDELVAALKEAFAYCGVAYINLTDANGAQRPASGRRTTNFSMLNWNLWHTWERYGNIVVYLRVNGLVPPSTDGGMPMTTPRVKMAKDTARR